MSNFLFFLSVLSFAFANKVTYRRNVLFTLQPGKATCFVKIVDRFGIINAEYQIIEKGVGVSNQTVSFEALGPSAGPGRRGGAAPRWPAAAAAFVLQAPELGQYRFCFDNIFDPQTKKTILFKLSVQTRSKRLENNKNRKQRKLMHPGRKIMILDPILPVPVPVLSGAESEVTLAELLNRKSDSMFTWKENQHQNMIRLSDFNNKLLNNGNKDLQEDIRQNQKNSKKVVASDNSLMEDLEFDSYPDLNDDPDDSEDVNDHGDRDVVSATETITGSRSWLPYRWDMIDYA